MARKSEITSQQVADIYELSDSGNSERKIAERLGLTQPQVHRVLSNRARITQQKEIVALASEPTVSQTRRSVFDITNGLQFCLEETERLLNLEFEKSEDPDNPVSEVKLRDRLAVRTELRQLFSEARATLESIYNIKLFDEFISEVTAILEEEKPGARSRIYERLKASNAWGATILFREPGK